MIGVCVRGIVVVGFVPEALGGHADTLSQNLADNALNNDFVAWNAQLLCLVFDVSNDGFGPLFVLLLIEFLVF